MQLEFDKESAFRCPNRIQESRSFAECQKRAGFIGKAEIESYAERGFVNFKLVGRGLPEELVKESYLYYLVKDEERDFIRGKLERTLADLRGAAGGVPGGAVPMGRPAGGRPAGGPMGGRPLPGYMPKGGKKR